MSPPHAGRGATEKSDIYVFPTVGTHLGLWTDLASYQPIRTLVNTECSNDADDPTAFSTPISRYWSTSIPSLGMAAYGDKDLWWVYAENSQDGLVWWSGSPRATG